MSAKKVTWNGKQYTIPKLAKELNVAKRTLYGRIEKLGIEKAIKVSLMLSGEYSQNRKGVSHKNYKGQRPDTWVYKYKGEMCSREAFAEHLGVKLTTFVGWVKRYGKENAISLAETPANLRNKKMQMLRNEKGFDERAANTENRQSKVDEVEIPKLDPDYELKNRIKYWIRHYGMEGAIAKASLRI